MPKFTVFCRQSNNVGTTYITTVEIEDNDAAKAGEAGLEECLTDWNPGGGEPDIYTSDNVSVLGVAEGDVKILMWDDIE